MATPRYFQVKSDFKKKYPERYEYLAKKLVESTNNPEFQKLMKDSGYVIDAKMPKDVEPLFYELYQSVLKYKDAF